MRALSLIFFLYSALATAREPELNVVFDYGLRHYELKTNKGKLTFVSPATKLSLERKKCNAKAYDSFIQRYSLMLGKYPHRKVVAQDKGKKIKKKKDFKRVLYKLFGKDTTYMALPQSELGQHFLKLPPSIAQLKRLSTLSCQKENKKSKEKN